MSARFRRRRRAGRGQSPVPTGSTGPVAGRSRSPPPPPPHAPDRRRRGTGRRHWCRRTRSLRAPHRMRLGVIGERHPRRDPVPAQTRAPRRARPRQRLGPRPRPRRPAGRRPGAGWTGADGPASAPSSNRQCGPGTNLTTSRPFSIVWTATSRSRMPSRSRIGFSIVIWPRSPTNTPVPYSTRQVCIAPGRLATPARSLRSGIDVPASGSHRAARAGRFAAEQVCRPCVMRLTCASYIRSRGKTPRAMSWARSADAPAGITAIRVVTRWTCVSTGMSGSPKQNSSTTEAVLGPTPSRRTQPVASSPRLHRADRARSRRAPRGSGAAPPGCGAPSAAPVRPRRWPTRPPRPARGRRRPSPGTAWPARRTRARR